VTDASHKPADDSKTRLRLPALYPIVDVDLCRHRGLDPVALADAFLKGGARLLQVRQKGRHHGGAELLATVRAIVRLALPLDATVIVNDRADIAAMAGAAGVHVGQEDLPPAAVREIAGKTTIVGLSTHTPAQVDEAAAAAAVDYIAVGPVFTTATKDTGYDARGLELVRYASAKGKPVVAIGGITLGTAAEVLAAGAASVAVISDLVSDPDPQHRVRLFLHALGRGSLG
jgi:thiamine-phosphate pyrophosphorylase